MKRQCLRNRLIPIAFAFSFSIPYLLYALFSCLWLNDRDKEFLSINRNNQLAFFIALLLYSIALFIYIVSIYYRNKKSLIKGSISIFKSNIQEVEVEALRIGIPAQDINSQAIINDYADMTSFKHRSESWIAKTFITPEAFADKKEYKRHCDMYLDSIVRRYYLIMYTLSGIEVKTYRRDINRPILDEFERGSIHNLYYDRSIAYFNLIRMEYGWSFDILLYDDKVLKAFVDHYLHYSKSDDFIYLHYHFQDVYVSLAKLFTEFAGYCLCNHYTISPISFGVYLQLLIDNGLNDNELHYYSYYYHIPVSVIQSIIDVILSNDKHYGNGKFMPASKSKIEEWFFMTVNKKYDLISEVYSKGAAYALQP